MYLALTNYCTGTIPAIFGSESRSSIAINCGNLLNDNKAVLFADLGNNLRLPWQSSFVDLLVAGYTQQRQHPGVPFPLIVK
jgi:hypothetical protein